MGRSQVFGPDHRPPVAASDAISRPAAELPQCRFSLQTFTVRRSLRRFAQAGRVVGFLIPRPPCRFLWFLRRLSFVVQVDGQATKRVPQCFEDVLHWHPYRQGRAVDSLERSLRAARELLNKDPDDEST